jgi:hypothetical protein
MQLAETVFFCCFCSIVSQDSLNSSRVEPLQIRPVFLPRNFVCVFQQSNSEIFELETLEANCNLNNFFHQEGLAATPAIHGNQRWNAKINKFLSI